MSRALRTVSRFTPAELDGFAATARFLGESEAGIDRLVSICNNFDPPGSVFQTIGELIPHSLGGLDEVVRYAASQSQNFNQAALGALRGARDLLGRFPGAKLRFEVESQTGRFLRIADIVVELPSTSALGHLRIEIKEYADLTLLDKGNAVKQFARDVHLEIQVPPPPGAHPLARIRWYVRRPAHEDGTLFTDAELGPAREQVKLSLLPAFDNPVIGDALLRRQLKQVFEEHIADIVQFF